MIDKIDKNFVDSAPKMIVLLGGVLGTSKAIVLSILENQGFFCIKNLPLFLLENTFPHILNNPQYKKNIVISLVSHLFLTHESFAIDHFHEKYQVNLSSWYIEATRNVLMKRYDETRKRHPFLDKKTILEYAINAMFSILGSDASITNYSLDTKNLSLHELRKILCQKLLSKEQLSTQINFFSFGFKYGVPQKAYYLFNVRSLSNPNWNRHLHLQTGLDSDVITYLTNMSQVL